MRRRCSSWCWRSAPSPVGNRSTPTMLIRRRRPHHDLRLHQSIPQRTPRRRPPAVRARARVARRLAIARWSCSRSRTARGTTVGRGFGDDAVPPPSVSDAGYFTDWTETDTKQNSLTQYVGQVTGARQPGTVNDCSAVGVVQHDGRQPLPPARHVGRSRRQLRRRARPTPLQRRGQRGQARSRALPVGHRRPRPLRRAGSARSATSTPNSLPAFAFVTPTLCNDGHDCTNAIVDHGRRRHVQPVLDSAAYRAGRVAVFVWYDEDHPVPNLWIAPTATAGPIDARRRGLRRHARGLGVDARPAVPRERVRRARHARGCARLIGARLGYSPSVQEHWYREAVLYSLDVDTFQDSDGDGIGDLRGLIGRLEYLARLGVTCLWLNPIHPSPRRDDGYDVTDYYAVVAGLGYARRLRRSAARGRQPRYAGDPRSGGEPHVGRAPMVPSRRGRSLSPYRDWYVWSDREPTDVRQGMVFPGVQTSTWSTIDARSRLVLPPLLDFEPDLNIANPGFVVRSYGSVASGCSSASRGSGSTRRRSSSN